jgi:TRAP-type mannitol/chloroaromatic compound transport system permease small subunit
VLGILFFGLIIWGIYEPMLHAWLSGEYDGEGALRVPAWPARAVVVVGSILVVASYGLSALRAARSFVTGEPDSVVTPAASTHI